jgi:hypothetical protein
MQAQKPEEFAAWMNANPDHPQRDLMLKERVVTGFRVVTLKKRDV